MYIFATNKVATMFINQKLKEYWGIQAETLQGQKNAANFFQL